MIKILIGFIVFAALALFMLMKSGGDIDMSGEKHGSEATHSEPAKSDAPAASPAAAPAAAPAAPAKP
ncbi:hypothetical protein [Hydrogenophaga sp. RWCD_12]|uniref:hypothetical protein n=1 Tax=Hydrogenophaga sp. RWCD_12 TaxID=3391190 RepID=UPI0039846BFD